MALDQIQAVGAGFPGLVDNRTGVVVQTANMPFRDTPVRQLFQQEWDVPFFLGNDANCAAIGEYWAGAAKGCDPAVVVTLGTGIGSGMVAGGRLFTGYANSGMEAGHMIIQPGRVPLRLRQSRLLGAVWLGHRPHSDDPPGDGAGPAQCSVGAMRLAISPRSRGGPPSRGPDRGTEPPFGCWRITARGCP